MTLRDLLKLLSPDTRISMSYNGNPIIVNSTLDSLPWIDLARYDCAQLHPNSIEVNDDGSLMIYLRVQPRGV